MKESGGDSAIQNIKKIKSKENLFFLLSYLTFLALMVIFLSKNYFVLAIGIAILTIFLFVLFSIKIETAIYFIFLSLFFESEQFSIFIANFRIRPINYFIFIIFVCMISRAIFKKDNFKNTPLDIPIFLYLCTNIIAINYAPDFFRAYKIFILLLSLVITYYIVVKLLDGNKKFDILFDMFLVIGFLEISFGLYQFFAAYLNQVFGLIMPVGPKGIMHAEYINFSFGRPYGTFVEPDWYGAICMFFAVVFLVLFFSKSEKRRGFHLAGLVISLTGLLLSFVRACWISLAIAIIIIILLNIRFKFLEVKFKRIVTLLCIIIAVILFLFSLTNSSILSVFTKNQKALSAVEDSNISETLTDRFSSGETHADFGKNNTRLLQWKQSIKLFLDSPVIGHGPGSFGVLGLFEGENIRYYNSLVENKVISENSKFDPNIILTILEDTGISGLICFIFLAFYFFKYNVIYLKNKNILNKNRCFSFFVGLIALFVSYFFTTGLWISFTWVILAMNISMLSKGYQNKIDIKEFK